MTQFLTASAFTLVLIGLNVGIIWLMLWGGERAATRARRERLAKSSCDVATTAALIEPVPAGMKSATRKVSSDRKPANVS